MKVAITSGDMEHSRERSAQKRLSLLHPFRSSVSVEVQQHRIGTGIQVISALAQMHAESHVAWFPKAVVRQTFNNFIQVRI